MLVALALTKKLHLAQVNYRAYFCCEPVMNAPASLHLFYACGSVRLRVSRSVKASGNVRLLNMCICVHRYACVSSHTAHK